MNRRSCACDGPVVVSAFGAGVQRCEDLGVTLPPPLPQSDAAHDACFWPYGARNQQEYDAKVASNELLQMGPYERAALRECMPRIRGLDDYQLKLRLQSYYDTNAYRYAAARMPDWFRQMCQTGALVPYVAGEEVARVAAPPSPPTRRPPAAAAPRRPSPRATAPRRRPPPVQTAVARAEPDEPDGDERIDVENLTRDDWNPGASMQEKDATLKAFLLACGKGLFPDLTDCDVPKDWVSPKGYPFGRLVWNRRRTFGSDGSDPNADQALLDAGFVPISSRCNAASADAAFKLHVPVLRAAAADGLGPGKQGKLATAVKWLRKRLAEMKSGRQKADKAVLNLAKELGDAAPAGAKSGNDGTYWAHDIRGRARALLAGDAAPPRPKKKPAARKPSAKPAPPRPKKPAARKAPVKNAADGARGKGTARDARRVPEQEPMDIDEEPAVGENECVSDNEVAPYEGDSSSDDEFVEKQRASTRRHKRRKVAASVPAASNALPPFKVGDRIEARFDDGDDWFPGTIVKCGYGGDAYSIKYDDGDEEPSVGSYNIRPARAKATKKPSGRPR